MSASNKLAHGSTVVSSTPAAPRRISLRPGDSVAVLTTLEREEPSQGVPVEAIRWTETHQG